MFIYNIIWRIDRSLDLLEQKFFLLLQELSASQRIVLYIDNLQWMDCWSVKLLQNIILHEANCLFILIAQTNYRKDLFDFSCSLQHYKKLTALEITPFPQEVTKAFVQKQLPEATYTNDVYVRLFKESGGNPLFLMEYVRQLRIGLKPDYMTEKIKAQLQFLLVGCTELEMHILTWVSFFKENATLNILAEISDYTMEELTLAVAKLTKRNLLLETLIDRSNLIPFSLCNQYFFI